MKEVSVGGEINLLGREFPPPADGSIYLNSGSCGRKPRSVVETLKVGLEEANCNPTRYTFIEGERFAAEARAAASALFEVDPGCLLITNSTSQGLQLILQSFLSGPDDELITTDHEHGITRTICQYLEEARGVTVHRLAVDPFKGSAALTDLVLARLSRKTRLVMVSEIDCFSGWRPSLTALAAELARADVPFLVDGAHAPGQGPLSLSDYPMWVGSGHKWLGGPNGTGFAFVSRRYIPHLKPLWLGDRFFSFKDDDLIRFEYQGTADVSRFAGLTAALELASDLNPALMRQRQLDLVRYLRQAVSVLPAHEIRTPDVDGESTGMLTVTFASARVPVEDLRETLWQKHRIWIQPDFFYGNPGHGMRISCHPATTRAEIDALIDALAGIMR